MNTYLTTLIDTIRGMISSVANPAESPVGALIALGSATLVGLILVAIAYLVLVVTSDRGRRRWSEPLPQQTAQESSPRSQALHRRRTVTWSIVALAVLAAAVSGWAYTSSDAFCQRCHFTSRAFESLAQGPHSAVSCAACHEGATVTSRISAKIRGIDNVRAQLAGQVSAGPVPAFVPDSACTACHSRSIEGTTTARGIVMRHSDLLDSGYACVDCHNTEAHGQSVARPVYPAMLTCIACHNGTGAPFECSTCHAQDPGVAVRRPQRYFRKAVITREDCRGCHSIESCNDCHGLELPHTRTFVEGYHALKAYRDKETCIGCHDIRKFCNKCHHFRKGLDARPGETVAREHDSFIPWHIGRVNARPQDPCGCHNRKVPDPRRICTYCHDGTATDH